MMVEEIQKSTELQTLIAECTAYDFKVMLEEGRRLLAESIAAVLHTMGWTGERRCPQ